MNVIAWLQGIWSVDVGIERSAAGKLRVADASANLRDLELRELIATTLTAIHASTHMSAGADPIRLDELKAPTDVTTLNATTGLHGLLKKLSGAATEFMNGAGSWIVPGSNSPGVLHVHATRTTTTAIDATAAVWPFDTSGGAFTATLPTAVGIADTVYHLKKISSDGNMLTIATTSSQTIDGSTTQAITAQWTCITVVSDGTQWLVI